MTADAFNKKRLSLTAVIPSGSRGIQMRYLKASMAGSLGFRSDDDR
jgi:hypothetical protein